MDQSRNNEGEAGRVPQGLGDAVQGAGRDPVAATARRTATTSDPTGAVVQWVLVGMLLVGLYLTSHFGSYLVFHSLAELFSILVAWVFFVLVWSTRRYLDNDYLLLVGIASLFIGLIDLVHTLAYKGMGVFAGYDANLPTQLWIAARYLQSLTLLLASGLLWRPATARIRLPVNAVLVAYAGITALALWAAFAGVFPTCYVEGVGLTPFKRISEYIISGVLVAAGLLLWGRRDRFERGVVYLLLGSIVVTIGAELAFTFYVGVYDFSNLVGHILKIVAFYMLYRATVVTGLERPSALIFRELKQREAALAESEARYRLLFDTMSEGFALHEIVRNEQGRPVDYRFLEMNPAFERLTGLRAADLIGKTVLQALPATEQHWIETYGRVALTGQPLQVDGYSQELGRHYRVSAYSPQPGRFAVVFEDVTERKRAEEERLETQRRLLHTQRLESLGRLAGGVAHNFNNALQSIIGNIELTLMAGTLSPDDRRQLEAALRSGHQAADLTRQMLAYSGRGRFVVGDVNLSRLVEESAAMLAASVAPDVTISLQLDADLPPVQADAGQMQQLLMNLVSNAAEAIGERVGAVSVATGQQACDGAILSRSRLDEKPPPGRFVYLEVTDNGEGMNAATQERLFDPFFTTKFTGRGLGMAAVLGIVRGHGGAIIVDSAVGRGTAVRVYFPVAGD